MGYVTYDNISERGTRKERVCLFRQLVACLKYTSLTSYIFRDDALLVFFEFSNH